jgi:hypothetical protein
VDEVLPGGHGDRQLLMEVGSPYSAIDQVLRAYRKGALSPDLALSTISLIMMEVSGEDVVNGPNTEGMEEDGEY